MDKTDRSFTIVTIKSNSKGTKTKEGGRFISKTPVAAAMKAFTQECRLSKVKGVCTHMITLRETTQDSKHKQYKYKVKRSKLKTPKKIQRGDTLVIIKYTVKAKSMN